MNIFVTGCAGFIGSHLCEALLKEGHVVLGVDNFNHFYDPELKRQNLEDIKKTAAEHKEFFQCYSGDICDADLIQSILTEHKIEVVIHLAAMAGVRPSIANPLLYERVNGTGTVTLLEEVRKAHIRNFIFGSSSSVYGLNQKVPFSEEDPVNLPYSPYAATKRAGELACHVYHKIYGLNVACLRFFTVYGPRQRPDLAIRKFTELMTQGKPIPIFGDGSYKRDYTYIDDIIDGVTKSMTWITQSHPSPKFEIFNLGESQTTMVLELITLLERAIGKTAKKDFFQPQPGDVPVTYADISKSRMILGYHPKTQIAEGIPKFVKWFQRVNLC